MRVDDVVADLELDLRERSLCLEILQLLFR